MGRHLHARLRMNWAILLCVVAVLLAQDRAFPQEKPAAFSRTVYTYKTVDQLKIQADVYRHEDGLRRPVVVWLHGGALIMGSRSGVPKQLRELAQEHGFVVVSLDYRLAPEAKLPDIIEDLKDGLQWVRKSGPERFDAGPSRMVVAGAIDQAFERSMEYIREHLSQ